MGVYGKYLKNRYRIHCKDKTCVAFSNSNNTICRECVAYNDKYNKCKSCGVKGTHKLGEFCADTFLCRYNRGVDVNDKPVAKEDFCKGCKRDFNNYPSQTVWIGPEHRLRRICVSCGYKNKVEPVEELVLECGTFNFELNPPRPYSWME